MPGGEATKAEIEELLHFAMEGRKRVKDQLLRIDTTYAAVDFSYWDKATGQVKSAENLEEKTYPTHYWREKEARSRNGSPTSKERPPKEVEAERRE